MATPDRILQLKLVSDTKGVQTGMKSVTKDMTKIQKAQSKVTSGFKGIGTAIIGLGALSIGVDILKGGIEDFFAAEKAATDFERVMEGLGRSVPRNMALVEKGMTDALSKNFDDTEFMQGVTTLVQQTRFSVPKALRIMRVAMDVAAAREIPLAAAIKLVKDALLQKKSALQKLGLPVDKMKKDSKQLARLEREFGGAATDAANTLPGRWKQIETQFGEGVEGLVASVFQMSDDFDTALGPQGVGGTIDGMSAVFDVSLEKARQSVADGTGPWIATAANLGLGIYNAIAGPIGLLPETVAQDIKLTQEQLNAVNTIQARAEFNRMIGVVEKAMDKVPNDTQTLVDRLEAIWAASALPGILGEIFRGVHRLSPFAGFIPRLAEGGIVDRPTLAVVGEKGPEAVVPLDGSGGVGMGGIVINITAGVGDPVEIGRQVDRVLRAYRGRAGLAA